MAKKKTKRIPKKPQKTIIFPLLKGSLGSVAAGLIIVGILLNWGLPFFVGWIMALRWGFLYQKAHPQVRILWQLAIALFVTMIVLVTIRDVQKNF